MEQRSRLARVVQEVAEISFSRAKREVEVGHVLVNGEVCRDPGSWITEGDRVEHRPELRRSRAAPQRPGIAVLCADRDVVVVDKPAGLLVHPTDLERDDTVLSRTIADLARRDGSPGRLFVVHRIDRETSGILLLARNHDAATFLQAQFRRHSIERRYLAIVQGALTEATTVDREIGRPRPQARRGALAPGSGGKRAVTTITPIGRGAGATLVAAELGTGRTHQVRVHLSYLGHPVLGDAVYGDPKIDPVAAPRLALHAAHLAFDHPGTGERKVFDVPLPDDLAALWRRLERRGVSAPAEPAARDRRASEAATAPPRPHSRRRSGGR